MLFMDAVIDFDYGINKFNLWGCDPTPEAILAGFIFDVVKALKGITVEAPVHIGDVILEDVAGTGIPIVATKEIL